MRNLFGTFCGYRVFLLMLILPSLSWGGAAITYHGRILDTQKRPLENPSVLFKIRVYSPNPEKCLLYEEVRTIDMTNSGGVFVVPIGDGQGTRTTADPGLQMEKVFANNPNVTLDNVNTPKLVCNSGSSFTPSLLSQRHLSVSFDDNSGVGEQILPLMDINFVPLAVNAYDSQNLGGTSANSYLRLSSGTATPLSPANFTELLNILNGSSNQYEKPGKLAGQNLPTLANGQVLGWNSGWVAVTPMTSYTETDPSVKAFAKSDLPTCNAGEFLAPNGSGGFACAAVSGASGGTVTSVTAGAGLKNSTNPGDPITNTGTLAVDVGTGANQIVQMGADAKLPAVDGSKLTNVVASGLSSTASINTSGSITTSGSLSVGQITASGNVQTTGDMTTRRLFFYDHSGVGPDSIGLQAPSDIAGAGGASYVLTLPEKKGATGQVLAAKDNSGTLEWISPSAGSVTNVTADAPLASSGGAIPNLSLPKAATGQDGYLAKEDWNTFNAKQNAGNYVTTLSGEVTSSGFAAGTVTTTISNNAVTANKIADGAVGSLSKVVASPGSAGTNRLLATDSTTGTTIKDFYCSTVGHVLKWTGAAGFGCNALTSADIANFNTDVDARITAQKGQANGLATLDASSKVPDAQIPNIDWSKVASKPSTLSGYGITDSLVFNGGGVGKITAGADGSKPGSPASGDLFVATDTQKIYRYNGAAWDLISSASGSGGTITGITAGTGLSGGGTSGSVSIGLGDTTVTAGSYGSATQVGTFTVDAQGRLTAASNVTISGTAPGGAAGGDLTDTYPNPKVAKLQGRAVDATLPLDGQVLLWDNGNTTWKANYVRMQDIRNAWGGTQMIPSAACGANQSMTWSVITDRFSCQAIGALDASAITAGTLDAALIPNLDIAKITTGTLSIARGGTNSGAALSNNRVMISNGGAIVESAAITANRALASNANGLPVASAVTDTELGYLSGVTSAIQTQLNAKASSAGWANYSVIGTNNSGAMTAISGSTSGTILQHSATGPVYSTATYPSATTANQLLYSSANNAVSGLTTANNAVLMTNGSGVPAFQALTGDLFGQYALLAGRSGGQILRGGTAASNTLTLDSTADATKGNIILAPSGGNVGIGTASPSTRLHVAAGNGREAQAVVGNELLNVNTSRTGLQVGSSTDVSEVMVGQDSTHFLNMAWIYNATPASSYGAMSTSSSSLPIVLQGSGGHVSIGTVGPVSPGTGRTYLTLKGASDAGVLELTQGAADSDGVMVGQIQFTDQNSTSSEKRVAGIVAYASGPTATKRGGSLHFFLKPDNGIAGDYAPKMSIFSDGRVGIGTTAPQAALHISPTITGAGPATSGTTPSTGLVTRLANQGGATLDHGMLNNGTQWLQGTNFADQSATFSIALNPNGGNVGIGTISPNSLLSLSKGVANSYNDALSINNPIGGSYSGSSILLNALSTNGVRIYSSILNATVGNEATDFLIQNYTSGAWVDRFKIDAFGRVGIGLTNPTYQLQLSTDSAAKPGTSTWTIASDERLKDIRAPFTRGLAAVNDLNTVYFNYKKDNALGLPSEKEYVGIKAQDALRAVPEAVSVDEQGYLHVTNDSIIWTAINAIKELYSKFQGQDQEIAALKAEVASSRAENEQLKINQSAMKDYLCKKDPDAIFCR